MDVIAHIRELILDALWPARCAGCGTVGTPACRACLDAVSVPRTQQCPSCGYSSLRGVPCPACRGRTHLDRVVAATALDEHSERFVHALKYRNLASLAAPLADRMCGLIAAHPAARDLLSASPVIVPVPLHGIRLYERGYNQAELLARRIATVTAMALRTDLLTRVRPTAPQVSTDSRARRRENMAGAFVASGCADLDILLIDDVTTTGATLGDCARALKEAGARSVSALTLAHG